jgi:hypothetical protein
VYKSRVTEIKMEGVLHLFSSCTILILFRSSTSSVNDSVTYLISFFLTLPFSVHNKLGYMNQQRMCSIQAKLYFQPFTDRRYIEQPSRPAPQTVTVSKSSYSSTSKSSSNQHSSSIQSNYKVKTSHCLESYN